MTLSRKLAKLMIEKRVSVDDMVQTLRTYNLLGLLPSIRNAVMQMASQKSAGGRIMIESPFELSDDSLLRIKRIIGNDLAPHEVTINKNLLAGFKARFKGILYDGSSERITRQFMANS